MSAPHQIALVSCVLAVGAAVPAHAAETLKLHGTLTSVNRTETKTITTERYKNRATGVFAARARIVQSSRTQRGSVKLTFKKGVLKLRYTVPTSDAAPVVGKVTGGTGKYKNASGTFRDVLRSKTTDNLTIKLA